MIDHTYVADRQLVDRYVVGGLTAEEQTAFEEHFVDCPQCLREIEIAEDFRRHLKSAGSRTLLADRGIFSWLAGWNVWQQAGAFAAVAVLLVVLPATVLLLERTRSTRDRQTISRLEEQVRGADSPTSASVSRLSIVRSAQATEELSRVEVTGSKWTVLSLEHEHDPAFTAYRASLRDSGGREIWLAGDLKAVAPDSLGILVPSRLFEDGDYVLTLEGIRQNERPDVIGRYRFRVAAKK
jgi:membrane protein implicated in regulation of membrane protease activity